MNGKSPEKSSPNLFSLDLYACRPFYTPAPLPRIDERALLYLFFNMRREGEEIHSDPIFTLSRM